MKSWGTQFISHLMIHFSMFQHWKPVAICGLSPLSDLSGHIHWSSPCQQLGDRPSPRHVHRPLPLQLSKLSPVPRWSQQNSRNIRLIFAVFFFRKCIHIYIYPYVMCNVSILYNFMMVNRRAVLLCRFVSSILSSLLLCSLLSRAAGGTLQWLQPTFIPFAIYPLMGDHKNHKSKTAQPEELSF